MFHYPVTYIEKDSIQVLKSEADLNTYIKGLKKRFLIYDGQYIQLSSLDVFARNGRNIYVNMVMSLYDTDSAIVAAQQVGFHLVKIDKQLKMISAGAHTD